MLWSLDDYWYYSLFTLLMVRHTRGPTLDQQAGSQAGLLLTRASLALYSWSSSRPQWSRAACATPMR